MTFEESLLQVEQQIKDLVWWSPDQIERGEDKINDPKKGERAWSVPRATGEFLHEMVLGRKPKVILELGTSIGYSTLWLADAVSKYGGHVYTIEKQEHKYNIAKENIKEARLDQVITFYNAEILDVLEKATEGKKIDFLFLDADRGHYHEYLKVLDSNSLLSPTAIIIADNAINMQTRMKPFLEALTKHGWKYEIKDLDNGLLIAKQNSVG